MCNLRDKLKNCILILVFSTRKNCRNGPYSLRQRSFHPIFFLYFTLHCVYKFLELLYFMNSFWSYNKNVEKSKNTSKRKNKINRTSQTKFCCSTFSMQRWIRGPILVQKIILIHLLYFFYFIHYILLCMK